MQLGEEMIDRSESFELARRFQERGFVIARNVVPPGLMTDLRDACEEFRNERDALAKQTGTAVIPDVIFRRQEFLLLLRLPALLSLLQAVLGPDLELVRSKVYWKPDQAGLGRVEWHQDYPANPHTHPDFATAMVYLDDTSPESGCLSMISGSHKRGIIDHWDEGTFVNECAEHVDLEQGEDVVDVTASAGDVSIHHSCTIHASYATRSGSARRSAAFMVRPTDCVQLGGSVHRSTGVLLSGTLDRSVRSTISGTRLPKRLYESVSLYALPVPRS